MNLLFSKTRSLFSKFKPRDILLLTPFVGLYLFLTLRNITASSIWFDEGFGITLSKFSFFDIAKYTAFDVHPPLYYWILKIWTFFFGYSEVAVRSLSTFFGVVALALIYFMIKDLFDKKSAVLAVFFSAISPMLIRYGEEARMYTLVLSIALIATWVFTYALKTNNKKYWTIYGVLIALGMWVHYFTALVWIVHWIYRAYTLRSEKHFIKTFFSKEWNKAHLIALLVYLPWLPIMLIQTSIVQAAGFWIGPVGADTFTNYLTNTFYYAEHNTVSSWLAFILAFLIGLSIFKYNKVYESMNNEHKEYIKIIGFIAVISPVALFVMSLPPLRPIFVERYLLTASVFVAILLGVIIANSHFSKVKQGLIVCLVVFISFIGIGNVYYFGNYNKNSNTQISTRDAINEAIKRSGNNEPIIAADPWVYYEAEIYSTPDHPIYFSDEHTSYKYGSLEMLKNTDNGKIKDIQKFVKDNYTFWYVGYADNELEAPYKNICKIDSFEIESSINHAKKYKGVQYRYCAL